MNDTIKSLISLQKVYKELFELERRKKSLTEKSSNHDKTIPELEDELDELKDELNTVKSEIKSNQVDIDTLKGEVQQLFEKQKIIQSPKEWSFLETQVKNKKSEIAELEKENASNLKQNNELEKKIEEKVKDLENITKNEEAEQSENQASLEKLELELQEKQKVKDEMAKGISLDALRNFERIANGKNGVGIVPIEGGTCSGCYISIPPQIFNKVRRNEEIIYCRNCARILYFVS